MRPSNQLSRRTNRVERRGAALIETLIALVILALTSAGIMSLLTQTLSSTRDLHVREREINDASRTIELVLSFSRAQLMAQVGLTRRQTNWLEVEQTGPSLFSIVVRDTLTRRELLHTTAYRPDSVL